MWSSKFSGLSLQTEKKIDIIGLIMPFTLTGVAAFNPKTAIYNNMVLYMQKIKPKFESKYLITNIASMNCDKTFCGTFWSTKNNKMLTKGN